MTSLQRVQFGKEDKVEKNLTNTTNTAADVVKVNIISDVDSIYPGHGGWEWHFIFAVFLPSMLTPIMRKTSDGPKLRAKLWSILTHVLQNSQVYKKPEEPEGLVTDHTSLEKWRLTVMWCPINRWVPGTGKGHQVKTKEVWIKYGILSVIMFVSLDKLSLVLTNVLLRSRAVPW